MKCLIKGVCELIFKKIEMSHHHDYHNHHHHNGGSLQSSDGVGGTSTSSSSLNLSQHIGISSNSHQNDCNYYGNDNWINVLSPMKQMEGKWKIEDLRKIL